MFMTGFMPFHADKRHNLVNNIISAEIDFDQEGFYNCSEEVKDLIEKMLKKEPTRRISAQDALKHPWFSSEAPANKQVNSLIL